MKTRRRIGLAILFTLAVVLVPYVFSRAVSSSRRVSVHRMAGVSTNASPESNPDSNPDSNPKSPTLRVACYNIAHGRGLAESNWEGGTADARAARLNAIAELLVTMDADIVVLNEVDFQSSWSHSTNQAEYLAKRAGYDHWAGQRNFDFRVLFWTWRFGNAVLSRHPILQADCVELPDYSPTETWLAGKKRAIACIVDLQAIKGTQVRVIGAHLSHRSESLRIQSAEKLVALATSGSMPTLIAGDLNSAPPGFPQSPASELGNTFDRFDAAKIFQRRPASPDNLTDALTFPADEPSKILDWILAPASWETMEYRVVASTLSDHRPVVAEFTWEQVDAAKDDDGE